MSVPGRAMRLTAKEYELLRVLSMNAGRVVTYASLPRSGCSRCPYQPRRSASRPTASGLGRGGS